MVWGAIATAVVGGIIGSIGDRQAHGDNRELSEQEFRQNLAMQNDQQAFEEYLVNRRNVAGGPAYGGPSGPTPNFWFGLEDQANSANIAEFMEPLQREGRVSQGRRAPLDTLAYGDRTRLDPETALGYQSREETRNPLHNLRQFLNQNPTQPNPPRGRWG